MQKEPLFWMGLWNLLRLISQSDKCVAPFCVNNGLRLPVLVNKVPELPPCTITTFQFRLNLFLNSTEADMWYVCKRCPTVTAFRKLVHKCNSNDPVMLLIQHYANTLSALMKILSVDTDWNWWLALLFRPFEGTFSHISLKNKNGKHERVTS